jgi:hypothetical protein
MIEFWTVEDTGWSNGVSWFKTAGTDSNPLRFESYKAALSYALDKKERFDQPATKWRVVHTTIDRTESSEVITREWTIV